jgi:hypothetical protein
VSGCSYMVFAIRERCQDVNGRGWAGERDELRWDAVQIVDKV